jgi:hypothetical protein
MMPVWLGMAFDWGYARRHATPTKKLCKFGWIRFWDGEERSDRHRLHSNACSSDQGQHGALASLCADRSHADQAKREMEAGEWWVGIANCTHYCSHRGQQTVEAGAYATTGITYKSMSGMGLWDSGQYGRVVCKAVLR